MGGARNVVSGILKKTLIDEIIFHIFSSCAQSSSSSSSSSLFSLCRAISALFSWPQNQNSQMPMTRLAVVEARREEAASAFSCRKQAIDTQFFEANEQRRHTTDEAKNENARFCRIIRVNEARRTLGTPKKNRTRSRALSNARESASARLRSPTCCSERSPDLHFERRRIGQRLRSRQLKNEVCSLLVASYRAAQSCARAREHRRCRRAPKRQRQRF